MLPRYVSHAAWQVRMYAARAAGQLRANAVLQQLARDAHDNVREAAIAELVRLKSPDAVSAALDALARPDYQLIITAAGALAAAPDKQRAIDALTAAYTRIAAQRHDTARDALVAIAERLKELGASVAALPAPASAQNSAKNAAPAITAQDLAALTATRLRFHMAGRGAFDLRLLPEEAPVTAAHIARLAREGYYNGLTFHRVVPNFVIQGGSPGANEYMGQGPFMRDEVGLVSHRRGTVGISTRGRDTGDAQIFINLVDLPRLDHTYTVFAEVVAGMDVVDAIVEGDVIERVEIVRGP
jgi:cyclophilin family peptidyl-prolyl cis-trans isomerase